ncbi:23S rRNA (pseudouridine(1915)-N(3))-methyltransferase RlmH [Sphingobacterium hungaricum]
MKITLICIGKTDDKYIDTGIEKYVNRLKHYTNFSLQIIPDLKNVKNLTQELQKEKESQLIFKHISNLDLVILLDEKGKEYRSVEFAKFIEAKQIASTQSIVFVVGGPYGFHQSLYTRANQLISLSKMTFSHQMIRLFFIEQVYRAYSILKGEPYHHE